MRALIALVLQDLGLDATCLLPPLARMMQASERALVNEGLEEGRESAVCFGREKPYSSLSTKIYIFMQCALNSYA